ncbi:MAG: septum formation initiator family protein [Muribaculaceae bacterium]
MIEKPNNWKGLRPKWVPAWMSVTFVAFVLFIGYTLFYGESSYINSNRHAQEIQQLKREIKQVKDSTNYYNRKVEELNTDKESLERIAREKYGMKRQNEDIYMTDMP